MDTITATPERINHAGEQYVGPRVNQQEVRAAGQVVSGFDLLHRRNLITREQFEASELLLRYWRGLRHRRGLVSSYGQQAWSGTTAGQEAHETADREDWSLICGDRIRDACRAVGNPKHWQAIMHMIEVDGTARDAGEALGYRCRKQAQAAGITVIESVLTTLAGHYGINAARPPG